MEKIEVKEKQNSMLLEMIVRTTRKGGKVTEVPVHFKDRIHGESKMNLSKQVPIFLKKVLVFGVKDRILRK